MCNVQWYGISTTILNCFFQYPLLVHNTTLRMCTPPTPITMNARLCWLPDASAWLAGLAWSRCWVVFTSALQLAAGQGPPRPASTVRCTGACAENPACPPQARWHKCASTGSAQASRARCPMSRGGSGVPAAVSVCASLASGVVAVGAG